MNRRQVFIDTETTGISARSGHRIIELAAVEAIDGRLSGKTLHTYLDPQRSIDPAAQRVHGIASAALVGKPKFQDIATDFMKFVEGAECLMHNAAFDRGFIDAELSRAGIERRLDDITTVTCTLKLARQCFPGASASLDALIVRAGIPVTRQKHSALEDAMLLADIYFSILAGLSNQQPSTAIQPLTAAAIVRQAVAEMVTPEALAMEKTIEMVMAKNETFYYRNQHKRIIEHHVINERRWRNVKGPLVYAVTDQQGLIRYIGKWVSPTPLQSRWLRHKTIHHQERARNMYIAELDSGRGPLAVWSTSVAELKRRLPITNNDLPDASVATALEALWIQRWKEHLTWNGRSEPLLAGFDDGEYWKE